MTAFVRHAGDGEWGTAVWEIRSVNHRYLDTSWRLPGELRELETQLRTTAQANLQRGKLDCQLRFTAGAAVAAEFTVNEALVSALVGAQEKVAHVINNHTPMQVMEAMSWPGALELKMPDLDVAKQAVLDLFEEAVIQLITHRAQEGDALRDMLTTRLSQLRKLLAQVVERRPQVIEQQRKQLTQRLEQLDVKLDSERLEQEMCYLVQKMDITEETDRLTAHFDAVTKLVDKGGAAGRRLDFYMQEFNREVNTIGSKANDAPITQAVVEMKVLVEQMREQIQNIE